MRTKTKLQREKKQPTNRGVFFRRCEELSLLSPTTSQTLMWPYQLISPRTWQKVLAVKKFSKEAAIEYANRTYPKVGLSAMRKGVQSGIADALCMLSYHKKHEGV